MGVAWQLHYRMATVALISPITELVIIEAIITISLECQPTQICATLYRLDLTNIYYFGFGVAARVGRNSRIVDYAASSHSASADADLCRFTLVQGETTP